MTAETQRQREARLLEEHQGLIWSVVRRYYGRGVEPEDLYQLGCLGFLKAVRGFDGERGTQFSTYAVPKIMGEIRRFLRDDGPVKVSRTLREQGARLGLARYKLEQALGRAPRLSELAAATGLTPEEAAVAESAGWETLSLQQETGEGTALADLLGDDGMEDGLVERLSLRQAISRLPEREREVVALRYYRGMTQTKAAQILGVSQVQVSRLEKRALEKLRAFLQTA